MSLALGSCRGALGPVLQSRARCLLGLIHLTTIHAFGLMLNGLSFLLGVITVRHEECLLDHLLEGFVPALAKALSPLSVPAPAQRIFGSISLARQPLRDLWVRNFKSEINDHVATIALVCPLDKIRRVAHAVLG